MKSVIWNVKAPRGSFCIICTARATKMIVMGKQYGHALDAEQFYICEECAEKLANKLREEAEE